MKNNFTKDWFLKNYSYNPKTGLIYSFLKNKNVGSYDYYGYKRISLSNGKQIKLHRLAWLLFYKKYPIGEIDHINGNKSDNRICNLRLATSQQNKFNRKKTLNKKTSIYKGVYFMKRDNVWCADFRINRKSKYIGRFNSEIEAAKAYDTTVLQIFGKFAKTNF